MTDMYPASSRRLAPLPASPRRLWQLAITGPGAAVVDEDTAQRLIAILERRPEVPFLTMATDQGEAHVTRDFPGHTIPHVDGLLSALFADQPAVSAVTFPAMGRQPAHTATPDAPYSLAIGANLVAIQAACERGEITPDEAVARIQALAHI
jgi:hypothetical protein